MRTRIVHFTPRPDQRKCEVVIQDSAPGRPGTRHGMHQASPASACRLLRLIHQTLATRPSAVDVFLHLDGWSVVVAGTV